MLYLTIIGGAFIAWLIFAVLFMPHIPSDLHPVLSAGQGVSRGHVTADFESDLAKSREITLDAWRSRPLWEKPIGAVAWILERQQ
jgi:hypothetical protein